MADPSPVPLDFSTIHQGAPVTIDGAPYQIRHPDALSLSGIRRLEVDAPVIHGLLQQDALTPAEEVRLSALLQRVCEAVLDAPAAVAATLSDAQRILIMRRFMQLRWPAPPPPAGATTRPGRRGKRSSRG
jgi:hypothetical protein